MNRRTVQLVCHVLLLMLAFSTTVTRAERDRLYSRLDPTCKGGVKGYVTSPKLPIEQVLVIPPDEPRLVYEGRISGSDRRAFVFEGLPMRRYDLVVIYEDRFYEGLQLQRGGNTLTSEDLKKIEAIVQLSEPFFTRKIIHRVEGTTGRGNFARCICTFLRDRPSEESSGHRRTFKLVILKDVGPGWQFVRSRDLYPLSVQPGLGLPRHHYSEALTRVRVTDYVKDLGEFSLSRQ